jgi:GDPmannose 4,6-dehydratase
MKKKRVLITGILGQDGSYLAELLQAKGYEVHGIEKQPLSPGAARIYQYLTGKHVEVMLHQCDLNAFAEVEVLMESIKPEECYHLAATHYSSEISELEKRGIDRSLFQNNVLSTLNLIYAIRDISPRTKFVLAGSCLMYDGLMQSPQNETMPFRSESVYGLSKIAASSILSHIRHVHNLHLSIAVLYNHESPRRSLNFVTKKIVSSLLKCKKGEIGSFHLGDLNIIRDWGYARDYVYGMWLMGQQVAPGNYILATGQGHTIKEFLECAAGILDVDWKKHVIVDAGVIVKPPEATMIGDPTLAKTKLRWTHSVNFRELINIMVQCEISGGLD